MGIEKLSVASMLAGIREAAVITCLDGNIIHYNNQMKRRLPNIDNAKIITEVFSLASKTFNVSCFKSFFMQSLMTIAWTRIVSNTRLNIPVPIAHTSNILLLP